MPKMMARPRASRTRVDTANSTPIAVTATWSIRPHSELRRVLRVLVGIADQIANLLGVGRLDVLDGFEDREALLVVDLRQMHGMHYMMALWVELDLAFRRVEGEAAFEYGNDLGRFDRPGLIGGHRPQMPAVPNGVCGIGDVGITGTEALVPCRDPLLVGRVVELLKI